MIRINNLFLQFNQKIIFDDAHLVINQNEKVGLIGINGSGKSTLFKIIQEVDNIPFSGNVEFIGNPQIGYLPQEISINSSDRLVDFAKLSMVKINSLETQITALQKRDLQGGEVDVQKSADRIAHLHEQLRLHGGYSADSAAKKVLSGLGFKNEEMGKPLNEFSGGWQIRAYLSQILLGDNSIILLDEPTNHLDIDSVIWLENYLKKIKKTVIIISHDHSFLDKIIDTTVSINSSKLIRYKGKISAFFEKTEKDDTHAEKQSQQIKQEIRLMEDFVQRFRYKASKAKQAQDRIKKIEQLKKELPKIKKASGYLNFHFPTPPKSAKEIAHISNMSFHFPNQERLLEDVTFDFYRGEKIALVGKNGTGKSTFIKLISGLLLPNQGNIEIHQDTKIGYYAQHIIENLNEGNNIIEEIEEQAEGNYLPNIRNILGVFMFSGDDQYKKISHLSGGEKARVALAKLFVSSVNFLILDEPTNHLDIESKKMLIKAINEFPGTVLVISHDLDLLENSIKKILYMDMHTIKIFDGNIFHFQEKVLKKFASEAGENIPQENQKLSLNQQQRIRQKKLNSRLRKMEMEISSLEEKINQLEEDISELKILSASEEYYSDGKKAHQLNIEIDNSEKSLGDFYNKWEFISTEIEQLRSDLAAIYN